MGHRYDKMNNFNISFYKEPPHIQKNSKKEVFVVHGDVQYIADICKGVGGKYYPLIMDAFTKRMIRGGWRIPVDMFETFMELILADESYDHMISSKTYPLLSDE